MTFVKICGITNLADGLAAAEAGADALGFNFYKPSRRYIAPSEAREIIENLPDRVLSVGVFVDESLETVRRVVQETHIGAVQLHGDESPEYCTELNGSYVIKAFAVGANFNVERTRNYDVAAIMLDASHNSLRGGTGRVADWTIARQMIELPVKVFLAGGLSPENVKQAIEIVEPYAVDACSLLEASPGIKDHERMRAFISAVRSSETSQK